MKEIRIEGLRSLKDTGNIPIKPLTILLGENSSGKSTFLRTFPLLIQSLETNTRGPILWYGPFVDFGQFEDAQSKFADDKKISFSFIFDAEDIVTAMPQQMASYTGLSDGELTVRFSLVNDERDNSTRVASFEIDYNDNKISVELNKSNKIESCVSKGIDLTDVFSDATMVNGSPGAPLLPAIKFKRTRGPYYSRLEELENEKLEKIFSEKLSPLLHSRTNRASFVSKVKKIQLVNKAELLNSLKSLSKTNTWKKKLQKFTPEHELISSLHAYILAEKMPILLHFINSKIANELDDVKYLAPLRATAERYYRSQDLSVGEVDFQGKNLAMFINNLSEKEKSNYSNWLLANFGFDLLCDSENGHLSLSLQYENSASKYNITDMGFGFSQILPIITQLWYSTNTRSSKRYLYQQKSNSYMVIEQPELHLHPRFQAKMVDVFAKAIKMTKNSKSGVQLKLIIETHSETIINQIGHRISTNSLSKDDVTVVIFDKKSPDTPTEIKISEFDDKGYLVNWPWGFFEPELS